METFPKRMAVRKGTRNLAPIKKYFKGSPFAGEFCPYCGENRLTAHHRYPICSQCQGKLRIDEKLLKTLQGRRLHIEQDEIDWQQRPHPELTGTIDEKGWRAIYMLERWSVQRVYGDNLQDSDVKLISEYLTTLTPSFVDRAKQEKTKVRRYVFLAALSTGVLATASYLLAKNLLKKRTDE